jgi:hypothetical protein
MQKLSTGFARLFINGRDTTPSCLRLQPFTSLRMIVAQVNCPTLKVSSAVVASAWKIKDKESFGNK